ncbi:hypothetical protein ES705_43578 [subsurface metagenome]
MASEREHEEIKRMLKEAEEENGVRIKRYNEESKEIEKDRVEIKKKGPRKRTTDMVVTWGNKILDEGFTMVPNVLIENYKNIGISDTQMLVLLAILRFSFRGRQPFPSQKTLSDITGYHRVTVTNAISGLKIKGYVKVTKRYIHRTKENPQRTSNKYNLKGLMDKLNSLEDEE